MTNLALSAKQGRTGLSARQTGLSVIVGAILWLIAALMLQVMGPMGIYEGANRVILYALIVPGTIPFLMAGFHIAGIHPHQRFVSTAIMLMAAMPLDGMALAWYPTLYGGTVELVAGAGATILWGAGIAAVLGYFMNKSQA